jgi:endonuclease G
LYIVSGPAGRGAWSAKGFHNTTDGHVVVPDKCWKLVLVLDPDPGDPAERVTADTRLIAVIMPNDHSLTEKWGRWRVRPRDVEELTGYTFFNKVPESVRKALREKKDDMHIPGE